MELTGISVVICTYNRGRILLRALETVARQETDGEFSYEIVVVDDGSTDRTRVVIEDFSTRVQVPVRYFREEGRGIAHVRNRGIEESFGEWIAFTDDDQLVEERWLKELFVVASETGAACVGGNRLLSVSVDPDLPLGPEVRKVLGEDIYDRESPIHRRQDLPGTENMLIRRSAFDAVGGFDASFVWGGEDTEFIRRLQTGGFKIWSAPRAVVYHLIPEYRLRQDYLKWASSRVGVCFADMDKKHWGNGRLVLACIARMGQAVMVNLSSLLLAALVGDKVTVMDRKCLLWRAVGYLRSCVFHIAPRWFPQRRFFERLEFRRERTHLGSSLD